MRWARRWRGADYAVVAPSPSPALTTISILEEGLHGLDALLRTGHQRQQNLAPIDADAPGGEHRLRFCPGRRRSAMPST